MQSKSYIVETALHWVSALLLLFMLLNLSSQLHNVDWDIKGQLEHRQDAVELQAFLALCTPKDNTVRSKSDNNCPINRLDTLSLADVCCSIRKTTKKQQTYLPD